DDLVQAQGFQVALKAFTTSCLATADCPLGAQGSSVQAAEGRLRALVVRSNSRPLASHLGTGQVADGAMLLNGVASALYSRSAWPTRPAGTAPCCSSWPTCWWSGTPTGPTPTWWTPTPRSAAWTGPSRAT